MTATQVPTLHPEITGWPPVKRAAPDASALGSQPVTNHIATDPRAMTKSDNPELAAAKRLLDIAKSRGFAFERIAPGPDGPLRGVRETLQFRDEVYLGGCGAPDSCSATRRRRSSLIVPGGLPVSQQLCGDALTVLHTVLWDWTA